MNVKIYTTSVCPWCVKTKEYLKANGVSYEEVNVGASREAAKEMIDKTGQRGVPVLDIDGNIVIGFDKSKIDSLLNIG